MDTIVSMLIWMILLVPFAFMFFQALQRVKCPDCGEMLPVICAPFKKTRRMWWAGGYICTQCGCETNMAGQKVTADTPPAPFPILHCTLLAVLLLIGVGLVASSIYVGERTPAPVVDAAPPLVPVIAPPPQAPAAAPVN